MDNYLKVNMNDVPSEDPHLAQHIKKGHTLEFFFVPSGGSEKPLTVKFKAFLTNMEDKFDSKWTADTVYGRMDPIATFQGTDRAISLGWTVLAYSGKEAEDNLKRMSKLISMCYPVYGGQNTSTRGAGQISGAPLIKLKFANLITAMGSNSQTKGKSNINSAAQNGLLGWIDGISFKPNLEAGFYDPSPGQLFPKQIDLACEFHVLHEHPLGWTRSTPSSEGGDQSDTTTKAGSLERATGVGYPYGSKFGTARPYAKPEVPADTKPDKPKGTDPPAVQPEETANPGASENDSATRKDSLSADKIVAGYRRAQLLESFDKGATENPTPQTPQQKKQQAKVSKLLDSVNPFKG